MDLIDFPGVTSQCVANSSGFCAATFTVPSTIWGPYQLAGRGETSQATSATMAFQVVTPSLSLSQSAGMNGTTLTVYASHFDPTESVYVYFDGSMYTTCRPNAGGNCSASFTVPGDGWGSFQVGGYGTASQAWAYASFQLVTPSVSFSQGSGAPGTTVTVTMSGFAPSDTVYLYFNGGYTGYACTADSTGSCSLAYPIPSYGWGLYTVSGNGSESGAWGYGSFQVVSPSVSLSPTSGQPGTDVSVYAHGYAPGEMLTIYYDGTSTGQGCWTDWTGYCAVGISVPAGTWGIHQIGALGGTSQASASAPFQVAVPSVTLSPTSGIVGTSVNATLTGYAPNETVDILFNGTRTGISCQADGNGDCTADFTVPAVSAFQYQVAGTGETSQDIRLGSVPRPDVPESGLRLGGLFGRGHARRLWRR